MDGPRRRRDRGEVRGGVAGHPGFQLAKRAVRVGLDPWRVLAPGDHVEKLVERALIEQADDDRLEEVAGFARGVGVVAGQVVALCMGADPEAVERVGRVMIGGGEQDGD